MTTMQGKQDKIDKLSISREHDSVLQMTADIGSLLESIEKTAKGLQQPGGLRQEDLPNLAEDLMRVTELQMVLLQKLKGINQRN